jgi:LTXXQ motif family protein
MALNSLSRTGALRNPRIAANPMARAQLAAAAAVVGWHGGAHGWWRHPNGGYGWVGPLFWPFAYYDIYDYTIWGDGAGFWGYGYLDVYAGLFGPYGYGGLAGYLEPPPPGRRPHSSIAAFAQMCADDSREIAGLPIDQIGQAIEPTEAQRAALDDLAGASIKAAQTIRTTCPKDIAATAPGRLAAMQQRIEGMISAVAVVRPPLDKLLSLLDDEQKARLNALAEGERNKALLNHANSSAAPGCAAPPPATVAWPADEVETRLHPNETQRAALKVLQDSAARAADALKTACQPSDVMTPSARLEAIAKRLDTMLQAVKSVRAALEDFYATLSDEQKAQFEAIGPKRTS